MANRTWDKESAEDRIQTRLNEVKTVVIKDYVRDTDLFSLPNGKAYRVDGVHLYVDILNIDDMLGTTTYEGETVHKRTLRFLNLHYRAVRRILIDVEAIQVDFHNQRLHAVFAKPYGDEAARVHRAVATAQLIIDVLAKTGENSDDPLPGAKVRVGIDTGKALAVSNGRRGNREPLFLGPPANLAAKRAGGGKKAGIFITDNAREVIDLDEVDNVDVTALTVEEIKISQDKAKLDVTVDRVVKEWEQGLKDHPIASIVFTAHTPPYRDLDIELLASANSRRQDAISIYADIDGFTKYVGDRVDDDEEAKDVVRALHVLRSELDAVLHEDFAGRKIRFIGDCVHGVLVEGTAQTTESSETSKNAMLCAAAMRSSFGVALDLLEEDGIDTGELGLAIGLEYGPIAITRLGIKGEKIRCCVSRAVLQSENEQLRCGGAQTAIGEQVHKKAPSALTDLFGTSRRRANFHYDEAVEALDNAAKVAKARSAGSSSLLRPATPAAGAGAAAAAAGFSFPATAAAPSKTPAGFA